MGFGVQFEEKVEEQKVETTQPEKKVEENQPKPQEAVQPQKPTPSKNDTPVQEVTNEMVLNFFKKQGKEISSIDDLFKTPETKEVEKIVEKNPFADVFDEYDKKYFEFKRDTGLGRKEFDFVQQDFSKKSILDLAYDKVRQDAGQDLSNVEIKQYLENKFNTDFTEELDPTTKIELNAFVKPFKDKLIQQQEKYKATVIDKPKNNDVEMIELEDGKKLPKAEYEEFINRRNDYLNNLQKSVSSATSFEVQTTFDNNGEKKPIKFNYEFSDEDRHSMLSDASDLDAFIGNTFKTEKGFDYKGLAEFLDKAKNFNKYVGLAMQQARAEAIEEFIANSNNENFSRKPLDKQKTGKEGYGDFTEGKQKRFGVKF